MKKLFFLIIQFITFTFCFQGTLLKRLFLCLQLFYFPQMFFLHIFEYFKPVIVDTDRLLMASADLLVTLFEHPFQGTDAQTVDKLTLMMSSK